MVCKYLQVKGKYCCTKVMSMADRVFVQEVLVQLDRTKGQAMPPLQQGICPFFFRSQTEKCPFFTPLAKQ
jgi:hypothetical protein